MIVSDLAAAAREKDRLSDTGSSDRWRVLPYETGAASGNLLLAAGIPAYRAIADRYGVDFFSEIRWESNCRVEEYVKAAKQIYAAGGKEIALWDTYPTRAIHPAEWDAVSRLGDPACAAGMPEDTAACHTIHRILSGRKGHAVRAPQLGRMRNVLSGAFRSSAVRLRICRS